MAQEKLTQEQLDSDQAGYLDLFLQNPKTRELLGIKPKEGLTWKDIIEHGKFYIIDLSGELKSGLSWKK